MEARAIEGPAAFKAPEWRELLKSQLNPHIFATADWHRLWWEEFGDGKKLITLVFEDPAPVAIASLVSDKTEGGVRVRFCGGDDLTDYLGPLLAPAADQGAVAKTLLLELSRQVPGWDYFDAKCMPVPFGFSEWLVEAAHALGMPFQVKLSDLTAVLPLPKSFDEYLEGLAPKKRHELRRKLRRFDREAPGAQLRRANAASLEQDLAKFVDLHRGSEGLKGKFMVPERATFFARAAHSFEPEGLLSLDFLESQGAVLACTFSFQYGGVFYLYNSAYDHNLSALSPGLVLVVRLIQRAIDQGLDRFDFLRGRERYKFDLGAEPLPLHTVEIRPTEGAPVAESRQTKPAKCGYHLLIRSSRKGR